MSEDLNQQRPDGAAGNAEPEAKPRGRRKVRRGTVVSDKMEKTVVVSVESRVRHPLYGRIVRRRKKYKAHDERNEFHVGDEVEIMECRPLSRDKTWRVFRLIARAQ